MGAWVREAVLTRLGNRNGFLRPVLTLASGAAGAHLITGAGLLLIARLYSPQDLGILGLFSSVIFTLAVASCLRFEVAIVLPRQDREGLDLMCLAMLSAGFTSLIIAAGVWAVLTWSLLPVGFSALAPYLWLLPVGNLAVGTYAAIQNWLVRQQSFGIVARTRVLQSVAATGTQAVAGLAGAGPIGLIAGFILNSGAVTLLLFRSVLRRLRELGGLPRLHTLGKLFRRYSDYPRYSIWEALANSAAVQVPVLMIGALTNPAEIGQLSLAMSVVQAPMALFGSATAQVFIAQAPARLRAGELRDFTLSTVRGLTRIGAPLMIAMGAVAPFAFPLVFGHDWSRAGVLVSWMTPWLLMQFLASPVTAVFNVTGRLRLALLVQLAGLVFRVGAVIAASNWMAGFETEAYSVSGAIFYGSLLLVLFKISTRVRNEDTA